MPLNPSQGIALFTDGSSYNKDKTGGWAFIAVDAFDNEEGFAGAATHTTNNRMEMQAVIEGLAMLALNFGAIDVLVCSDSEYVVLGATHPSRARRKNVDLWGKLDSSIRRHNYVEFMHVRGHDGNHYHEMADELAGKARKGLL